MNPWRNNGILTVCLHDKPCSLVGYSDALVWRKHLDSRFKERVLMKFVGHGGNRYFGLHSEAFMKTTQVPIQIERSSSSRYPLFYHVYSLRTHLSRRVAPPERTEKSYPALHVRCDRNFNNPPRDIFINIPGSESHGQRSRVESALNVDMVYSCSVSVSRLCSGSF